MADDPTGNPRLTVTLGVELDKESLSKVIEAVESAGGNILTQTVKDSVKKVSTDPSFKSILGRAFGLEYESDGAGGEKVTAASKYGMGSKSAGIAADGLIKVVKSGFGIIEDIYAQLVKASPLLQAVETLFDLAMQLFFMPLGNKLAEQMIPAVLQMVDDVMNMWESMEGMTLPQIFDMTIHKFTEIFLGYIKNIGEMLASQGGFLGQIGRFIKSTATFIEKFLPFLAEKVMGIMGFVMDFFPAIIGLVTALKLEQWVLGLAQIAATLIKDDSSIITSILTAGTGIAIVGGILAGAGTAIASHADGGYVPATNGGSLNLLGEGGEGEWVIPDSKVADFAVQHMPNNMRVNNYGGGDNFTINVYGYTDRELGGIIEDKVNELSNRSRLRSGF